NREFVKQDYEFYKALCLAKLAMTEGGDKTAAITALRNFATAAPQNYHFYEAAEMLGDLAMASGKYADAARFYTPIAAAPWADYQLRANYSVGRALIGEKQFDQALERFEKVIGSDNTTAEAAHQKQLATVGKAACLAETGKAESAVGTLQEIINK